MIKLYSDKWAVTITGGGEALLQQKTGGNIFLILLEGKKKSCKFLVTRKIKMIGTATQEIIK